jgi:cytochrome P450
VEHVALVGFLIAAPWPFWRLAASTPVRQRRRDQVVLVGALVGYVAVVLVAAVAWRPGLLILAASAAVVVAALWWRSRPDHGRRSRVPPGRIGVQPLGLYEDPDFLIGEAERYGPIFKIGATFPVPTLTPIICVVGHELGLALLRDHERSLEVYPPFPGSRYIPRGFMRNMTAADHDRYAPIFRRAVTKAADEAFEGAVAAKARAVVARMTADSLAAGGQGIPPRPYLREFTFDVLAGLLFGVEVGSAGHTDLAARFRALDMGGIAQRLPQGTWRRRWSATVDHLGGSVGTRGVLHEAVELAAATPLDIDTATERATIVGNVMQMQESGTTDLTGLLTWVVKQLGDHPEWLERVHEDVPVIGHPSLSDRIIRESLRLEQSEFLNRRMTEDLEFHGFRLPKGWRLRICIREGHRSAKVFDRPTEFDPDRWRGATHPLSEYAPFGLYRHHCLAARLTHRIGAILVEELAGTARLSITRDGPREHGRFHWQPSRHLRIAIESR